MKKKVGILFQPRIQAARDLASQLETVVADLGPSVWVCSARDEAKAAEVVQGTELLISLGGDGTILRAARIASPLSIPIVGVNLGRLGFMTELRPEEALDLVPALVRGSGRIEERAMLQAEVKGSEDAPLHALNDIVVGRAERCRLIRIRAIVDGDPLTTYKCDGLIVATATGSTGYALAAGGPVLHPLSRDMIMQPIAAHLSFGSGLILQPDTTVELEVSTTHGATLSVDGQVEVPLSDGAVVRAKRSAYVTRLVRSERPKPFYETLMEKLQKRE